MDRGRLRRQGACKPILSHCVFTVGLSQAVLSLNPLPLCKMIRILKQVFKKKKQLETQQVLKKKLCGLTITQLHVGRREWSTLVSDF